MATNPTPIQPNEDQIAAEKFIAARNKRGGAHK